ncbi:MAG: hypothetical protein ACTHKK_00380 [Candidatus Nitrosocosmicus sp.]
MRILIPLLLLSVFLIPLVQSSYAQESGLQSLFSTIIPKIQNFTHTLNAKMQDLKNNASSEFNQSSSNAKQSLFSTIIPKIQNFTHKLNAKIQYLKNNESSEFNHGDIGINQGLNKTKPFLGQLYNKIIPNTY